MKNSYETQIDSLKKQLNEEKTKNKVLSDENNRLKRLVNNLKNNINDYYIKKIKSLENEISKYKSNLNNIQIDYSVNSVKPGEKLITINFVSMGIEDVINYEIPCRNSDLFTRIEEKLNNDFPILKEHETYFESNGKRIKRFKTLDENKIETNDIINIFLNDEIGRAHV